jgi:glycine betaine/choline ABC-type transport system substrate-binding protein
VIRALGLAVALAGILIVAPAHGQTAPPRLAAPSDCLTNPNCGPGLRRVYKVDVKPVFVPLAAADSGISALDDGLGEIAVAFSSNPEVSRPDIVTLRDDRKMVGPDPIVPVVRNSLVRAYGKHLLRRLDVASAVLTTRALRQLNQSVEDGRLPEAVGGEFIDANALGGNGGHRRGPRIVVGFQDFAENETLAYMYAEALSSDGYRVKVRSAGGLRADTLRALRRGKIDMYPGYAGSLLTFIAGKRPKTPARIMRALRKQLAKRHLRPARRTPAQDRNVFVTKTDTARALGIQTVSDLARLWR